MPADCTGGGGGRGGGDGVSEMDLCIFSWTERLYRRYLSALELLLGGLKGSHLASSTEVAGMLGEPCCPPCSTDVEPPLFRRTLLRSSVSPHWSPPPFAPGVGGSSQLIGVQCSVTLSAVRLPWSTLETACCGSCASPAPRSSCPRDGRGPSFSSSLECALLTMEGLRFRAVGGL